MLIFFLTCLALGAFVGYVAGLFGIGGGMIIVPALVYLLPQIGVPESALISTALGTSFATIIITSFSSAQRHHKLGNVDWSSAKYLVPSIMLSVFIAGFFVTRLDKEISSKIFACIVVYMAVKMFLSIKPKADNKPFTPKIAIIGGLLIGTISSAAGIGGGGFTVSFLNSRGVDMRKAIGTSSVCAALLGISATLSFIFSGLNQAAMPAFSLGYVYIPAVLGITLTSFFTSKLGATTVNKLPISTLKKAFSVLLAIIALKMFLF